MGKIGLKTVFLGLFTAVALSFLPAETQAGNPVSNFGALWQNNIQSASQNVQEAGGIETIGSYFHSNKPHEQLCLYDPTWLAWQTMKAAPKIGLYLLIFPVTCSPDQVKYVAEHISPDLHTQAGWYNTVRWWKPIFDTISKAAVNVTNTIFNESKGMCMKLLGLGLAFWLALSTLPMVASFKEQNPADYLQKVGTMLFKGMIAALLLNNRDWFFGYLVSPIISIAAGFVGIQTSSGVGVESVVQPLEQMLNVMHTAVSEIKAAGHLLMGPLTWIGGLMFRFGFAINLWIVNIDLGTGDLTLFPLPNLFVWTGGCFMWGCGLLLGIAFPLRIFDTMFRLGIILSLSPLYIVSWVFPVTVDFTKKGFSALLHVAFLFIVLYVVLVMSVQVIFAAIGVNTQLSGASLYYSLIKPFINLAFLLAHVFTMLIATAFCLMFLSKTDELAGHFAGASFSAGPAEQMGVKMAKAVGGKAAEGLKKVGGAALKGIGDAHKEKQAATMSRMKNTYQSGKTDANGRFVDKDARKAERYLKRHGELNKKNGPHYAASAQEKKDLIAYNNGLSAKKGTEEYNKFHDRDENGQLKDKEARAMENRLQKANLVDKDGNVTGRLPPSFEPPPSEKMIGKERIETLKDHPDTLAKAADDILKHPEWYKQKPNGSFKNDRAQKTISMAREAGFLDEKGQLTESGKFHVQRYDNLAKGRATRTANTQSK